MIKKKKYHRNEFVGAAPATIHYVARVNAGTIYSVSGVIHNSSAVSHTAHGCQLPATHSLRASWSNYKLLRCCCCCCIISVGFQSCKHRSSLLARDVSHLGFVCRNVTCYEHEHANPCRDREDSERREKCMRSRILFHARVNRMRIIPAKTMRSRVHESQAASDNLLKFRTKPSHLMRDTTAARAGAT